MRIRISQSGGFAGVPIDVATVDTTAVSRERAAQLEELVDDATFFGLPAHVSAKGHDVGADNDGSYSITVERGSRSHTVSFGETGNGLARSAPAKLDALVREVVGEGSP